DAPRPPPLVVVIPGSADFDVTSIKPQTTRVSGVALDLWYIHDVVAPVRRHPDRLCACNETGGDGYPDMVFEFDVCDIVAAVEADTANDLLTLVLTAELTAGGSVTGGDCLRIYRPGEVPDPDSVDQLPGAILPLENYPNPFNSGTVIHFSLGRGGSVLLEVFNILGQRVRTLATGTRQSGPHQLSWNGRDDSGRPLASGMYLCRLSAPDRREVRKMVLLR
ncbi:MAG TPA: FlgD immunoglobulin-like domain containing protein, partial [Acidobacteriota bacterium]|nr:FlgD immunoglobulin-like domain containing protein [Acidobacteriota bacterium]